MRGGNRVDTGGIWEDFLLRLEEDEQKGERTIQMTHKFSN
jgi:hypothetical protein